MPMKQYLRFSRRHALRAILRKPSCARIARLQSKDAFKFRLCTGVVPFFHVGAAKVEARHVKAGVKRAGRFEVADGVVEQTVACGCAADVVQAFGNADSSSVCQV